MGPLDGPGGHEPVRPGQAEHGRGHLLAHPAHVVHRRQQALGPDHGVETPVGDLGDAAVEDQPPALDPVHQVAQLALRPRRVGPAVHSRPADSDGAGAAALA